MRAPTNVLRRSAVAAAGLGSIALAAAPAATAAPPEKPSFFTGGAATAGWVKDAPGDKAIAFTVPDATSYAGVTLQGASSTLPDTEPSFAFSSSVSSTSSGGSPRLVVHWSGGGTSSLRPLSWTANDWTTVSGSLWEDSAGCAGGYNISYADLQSCHAGDSIRSVTVVTDSGWVTAPYTHLVDDIVFGNLTVSEPAGGGKK